VDAIREFLGSLTQWSPSATQLRLLQSAGVVLVMSLLHWLVMRFVYRRVSDVRMQYQTRKAVTYVAFVVGALVVARLWFVGLQTLSTFLGLLTAALAIALQDPIVNLAGWLFLITRRPFRVGDRIQIGDIRGDVIDMRIFQFSLLEIGNWVDADQSTGRVIHVPNGKVFREPQASYTEGFQFIWNEIGVLVTFESNWRKAKEKLAEIAERNSAHLTEAAAERVRRAARKYMIFYSKLEPTVYTTVADSGVMLTIRYICAPKQRRGTTQQIWEEILDAFAAESDIDFAYPTTRYYDNPIEGKSGARAERPRRAFEAEGGGDG
jgi:small-conductance mechanosensitive channel